MRKRRFGLAIAVLLLITLGVSLWHRSERAHVRVKPVWVPMRFDAPASVEREFRTELDATYTIRIRADTDPYRLQQLLGRTPEWRGTPLLRWTLRSGARTVAQGHGRIGQLLTWDRGPRTLGSFQGRAGVTWQLNAEIETPMPELATVAGHLVTAPKGPQVKSGIVGAMLWAQASLVAFGAAGLVVLASGVAWIARRRPDPDRRSPGDRG